MSRSERSRLPGRSRWLTAILVVAWAGSAAWATDPSPTFLHSTSVFGCATCHKAESDALALTPHDSKGFAAMAEEDLTCDSCHGVTKAHAEDPGNKQLMEALGLTNVGQLGTLTPTELSARCLKHHQDTSHRFWSGSRHEARGLSCVSCHSAHAYQSEAKLLKGRDASETCYQCHKDVRAEMQRTSHHPVREGRMDCTDCHDQHGSPAEKLLRADSVNDLCNGCHADKRGPFLWEHPPVRERCTECHTPHGSNHRSLMRAAMPYLCQRCHSNTRHPGTLYDATRLPGGSAPSNRLFNRSCLNCHTTIHGSNHPSGTYLGR